jgi:CDP-glucose 4,6-dehydratase
MENLAMKNKIDTDFWRGKRVFLTGHTGFKGGWISIWLQKLGADLTGYALEPATIPNLFNAANVSHGMHSITGDIRDADKLAESVTLARPEIVIHMAAQPLVRYSYLHPVNTYTTNIIGTVNLFEALRKTDSVKAVVNITSDKCYENREWVWGYRESDPMGGYDPYSSSKGCAELITSAYRNSYFNSFGNSGHGVALASARAGNVIGGGDWAEDRLVPDIFRSIDAGKPVKIRNPNAIRPWQHVLEPLCGYLLLAQKLYHEGSRFAEPWNFGPSDEDAKPVEWIVKRLINHWGEGAQWEIDHSEHPHEAHYLKLDCSKSHQRLNWYPKWNLETALEKIVNWHRALMKNENMKTITEQQINEYNAD